MDMIIQNLNYSSVILTLVFFVLVIMLITLFNFYLLFGNYLKTSNKGKIKKADNKPDNMPTEQSKLVNEALDAVEEAWEESYYGAEFEGRLAEIRNKYTESEDSGDERCS